jgi:alkanesulfonate monooxygenase SsuD/methylene tetrahydromethanopterin reductase-like flavin-dependent oxidoreductase (luciferase family)
VLDIPYHNPVTLARRLTTLDLLSNGRLRLGLGLGWSKDEMDAVGADMKKRGAMADEFLRLLKAVWTSNPVEFHGKFYHVPKSYIGPKLVQKPHPPIYIAAYAPAALKRLAAMANGWNPVGIPVAGMAQMFGSVKQMAKDTGRDPSSLELVVRANLEITDKPLPKERRIFSGNMDQIKV